MIRIYLISWIVCCLCLNISQNIFAQSDSCAYSLGGKILYSNQEAMVGALVYVKETRQQTLTNYKGEFYINHICLANCTIVCQVLGAKRIEQAIDLTQRRAKNLVIKMEENLQELKAVEIKAQKILVSAVQTVHTLNQEMMDKNKGKMLAEALKEIAGVNTLQTGPSIFKPIIHGLHSNRILVLNNGVRQEGQQWGLDHALEIDPFVAEQLSVVKGAMAVRYGAEAMGGVVMISPLNLKNITHLQTEANLIGASNNRMGALSAKVASKLGNKGWAWSLQATAKKAGDSFSPTYNLSNTGFGEINFAANIGWHNQKQGVEFYYSRFSTQLGILRAAHIGNLNDFRFALQSSEPWFVRNFTYEIITPSQKISHDLAKWVMYKTWEKIGKLQFQTSLQYNQRREFDTRRANLTNVPAMYLQLLSQQNELTFEHHTWHGLQGLFGFNINYQDNYNVPTTRSRVFIPDYEALDLGFYLSEKYVKPQFEAEVGLRYDKRMLRTFGRDFFNSDSTFSYYRQFENITSTLGFAYFLSKNTTFRSSLAKAWRPPAPNELFSAGLHHGVAAFEYGDANLQPETSYKWVNTFNQNFSWLDVELTLYYQQFRNFIYLKPNPQGNLTINGYYPVFNFKQTEATFQGIDLTAQLNYTQNFYLRLKGAIVQARDTRNNTYLPFIPANQLETHLTYKFKKINKTEKFYLTLSNQSVARQNRYTAESDFAPPPAGYSLWNFDSSITQKWNEKYSLTVGLAVHNIFNNIYRDYLNRFRYFSNEIGRNFTLRLKLTFNAENTISPKE